jgi:hypothetical protein
MVESVAYEPPPGFVAACLAAAGAHLLASLLIGVVMVPLTLVTWTGIAFSGDASTASFRLLLPWLLALALQPFVAAWIAQRGLALFDAGRVTYWRACGAMVLGLFISAGSAFALPAEAALPVLGYAWTGALAAAVVLMGQPTPSASPLR